MTRVVCVISVAVLWVYLRSIEFGTAFSSHDMVRLRNDLLSNYSVGVLPLRNQSRSLSVNMSFFLIMIHNLNMKNQIMTASGWLKFEWCDEFLQWSPSMYGGIDELILFQKDVWLPDIFVENTAQHYRELGNNQMLISVKSSGMVHWEPGIITETSCAVNIGKYPFDTQVCDIRFLTWMHTNKTLTVEPEIDVINLDALLPNGEWDITRTEANVYRYPSTYRPGTDHTGVTFVVHLRRKRFFYVLNTIIPVVMLSCLNVLVFILPSDCGERMALAVTVLLAFTVYLGIISDNIPKTSESLSLLAIYLTSLLALSTASVVCAGIVLNIHYRDPSHAVPGVLKWMFSSFNSRDSRFKPVSCGGESKRSSVSQWDRRPAFWDLRRSRDYPIEEKYEDKEDVNKEAEKVFISTTPSPAETYSITTNSNAKRRESGRLSDANEEDAADRNNIELDLSVNRGNDLRCSSEGLDPHICQVNHANDCRTHRYDVLSFAERDFCTSTAPKSPYDDNNLQISVNKRKSKFHETSKQCKPELRDKYNATNTARSEVRCLLDEDVNKEEQTGKDSDVTWHDIGNSLDRSLFWIFFLVTNTLSVFILVLFVKDDV